MATPINYTDARLNAVQESNAIRTGIVRQARSRELLVEVAGATFSAAYFDGSLAPVPGDLVAIVRQDSTWLCLGRLSGINPDLNLLSNGDFSESAVGTVPSGWTLRSIAGTPIAGSAVSVQQDSDSPDVTQVAELTNSTTNNAHVALVSTAIPARANQTFRIEGYVSTFGFIPSGTLVIPPANVQIFASWHINSTSAFPEPSATVLDKFTMVEQLVDLRESWPYSQIGGAVKVPNSSAITHMRVVLAAIMSNAATAGSVRWASVQVKGLS